MNTVSKQFRSPTLQSHRYQLSTSPESFRAYICMAKDVQVLCHFPGHASSLFRMLNNNNKHKSNQIY